VNIVYFGANGVINRKKISGIQTPESKSSSRGRITKAILTRAVYSQFVPTPKANLTLRPDHKPNPNPYSNPSLNPNLKAGDIRPVTVKIANRIFIWQPEI